MKIKFILFVILILFIIGCTDGKYELNNQTLRETTGVILKKNYYLTKSGTTFQIYYFDGISADWLTTDETIYKKYQVKDTMHVMIVERTYFKIVKK